MTGALPLFFKPVIRASSGVVLTFPTASVTKYVVKSTEKRNIKNVLMVIHSYSHTGRGWVGLVVCFSFLLK